MATRKGSGSSSSSSTPEVTYQHDDVSGVHSIGIEVDGHFVAFASLDDAVVDQRAENAANRSSSSSSSDEEE